LLGVGHAAIVEMLMISSSAADILNPELDLAPYREDFERYGRVRIPDILKLDFAEEIYAAFQRAPWGALFRSNEKTVSVSQEGLAAYTSQDLMKLRKLIFAETSKGFQFSYRSLSMKDAKGAAWDNKQVLPALSACLNSGEFLEIGRAASGFGNIRSITAQATCYVPESFLSVHDDVADEKKNRLVAYVLGFAKDWKIDWGGLLQFHDPDGSRIIDSFLPIFNGLTLFRVPQWHSVSFVTPFALGPRFSVTGWYYGEEAKNNGNSTKSSGHAA
jgi:Rps23 Pro-64 3,4-dihydroxylase Tpa1-like proline 4-hydroxylase